MFVIPVYRSPEYSSVPRVNISDIDTSIPGIKESIRESAPGQLRQHQFALSTGFPHGLMPSQVAGSNFTYGARTPDNSNVNILGTDEASIQTHIEVTQFIHFELTFLRVMAFAQVQQREQELLSLHKKPI